MADAVFPVKQVRGPDNNRSRTSVHSSSNDLGFMWEVGSLCDFESGFFKDVAGEDRFVAFVDTFGVGRSCIEEIWARVISDVVRVVSLEVQTRPIYWWKSHRRWHIHGATIYILEFRRGTPKPKRPL